MTETMTDCPVCEQGVLGRTYITTPFEYKGYRTHAVHESCICSYCEANVTDARAARINKLKVLRFKALIDFGLDENRMSDAVLLALYDRRPEPHGLPADFWMMKLSRIKGEYRLPRWKMCAQFKVGL